MYTGSTSVKPGVVWQASTCKYNRDDYPTTDFGENIFENVNVSLDIYIQHIEITKDDL